MASDSSWTNSSRGVVNGIVKILPFFDYLAPEPQTHRITPCGTHAACQHPPRRTLGRPFANTRGAIAAGRSEWFAASGCHKQGLWRGLFHAGPQPPELCRRFLLARSDRLEQCFVAGALSRLSD